MDQNKIVDQLEETEKDVRKNCVKDSEKMSNRLTPKLLGLSEDKSWIELELTDKEDIRIWRLLMCDDMVQVCPDCGKPIHVEELVPRLNTPIYPGRMPVPFNEAIGVCPNCKSIIHRENTETGYPFTGADYVRDSLLAVLKQRQNKKA